MNYRAAGLRIRASGFAIVAGWAAAVVVTLPMQVFQIITNDLDGRRSLLWSLAAGILIWLGWTLWIAAMGWALVCLPAIAILREKWLLRHRRAVTAGSAALALLTAITEFTSWRFFTPAFTFHPWMFSLYALLLTVFAATTAAVYLRAVERIRLSERSFVGTRGVD
jgi:hypothetical protein